MVYEFREWRQGDWSPRNFQGTWVLIYDGEQVGAMAGAIFDVQGIAVKPKGQKHGTEFVRQIIDKAREIEGKYKFGTKWIKFEGVIGDSVKDRQALEHILRDKFGFEQVDKETWRLKL